MSEEKILLKRKLERFEEQLDNFNRIKPGSGHFTDYNSRYLLRSRFESRQILEKVEEDSLRKKFGDLEEEFQEKIDQKFIEAAEEELDFVLDKMREIVNHFSELDPIINETQNDLDYRDSIEHLSNFLEEQDVKVDHKQVEELNRELREKYISDIDKILEFKESISRSYLPEEFWWRHPEEVKENGA